MKPGTYTVTLFQGELEAGTGSVTVKAGSSASVTLKSSLNVPSTIWKIGTVDGTPSGVCLHSLSTNHRFLTPM